MVSSFRWFSSGVSASLGVGLPSIGMPILSGVATFASHVSSACMLPLVGAPFLITSMVTSAVPAKIRVGGTRKRRVAGDRDTLWARSIGF